MGRIILVFLLGVIFAPAAFAASCGLADDSQLIFRISGTTNAHAELWDEDNYLPPVGTEICYNKIFGFAYTAPSPHSGNTILKAFAATNSHVEIVGVNTPGYATEIKYGELSCTYGASCDSAAGERCIATISGTTNAHVSDCSGGGSYPEKICCETSFTPAVPSCAVSVSPGYIGETEFVDVTVPYYGFTPAATGHTISCGGASITPGAIGCADGDCLFKCGPYDSAGAYNVSVSLENDSGGPQINCGTGAVNVGTDVACSVSAVNPGTVNTGESTSVSVSYFNFSALPTAGAINCGDAATAGPVSCAAGTCNFSCNNYDTQGTFAIAAQLMDGIVPINCAQGQITVDAPAVPGAFRIASFSIEPNSIQQGGSGNAVVKVKNNSAGSAEAVVRLTIVDAAGNVPDSFSEIQSPQQTIGASGTALDTVIFTVPFNVTDEWNMGAYIATAKVFDTTATPKQHDKALANFTVGQKLTAGPELNAAILPVIAAIILAIVFLKQKRKK